MNGELLQQMSIAPAKTLCNPIYTPATDCTVGFVVVPEHEMALHVILLVVSVELFNASNSYTEK